MATNRPDDEVKLEENRPVQESPKELDDEEKIFVLPVSLAMKKQLLVKLYMYLLSDIDFYD